MSALLRDFRHGLRLLRKTPALAFIIVVTLGLGIGVNTIAFSWVYAVLYHPLGGVSTDISRLVVILQQNRVGEDGHEISYLELQEVATHRDIFCGTAGDHQCQLNMQADGQVDWVWAQAVSPGFFDFYGVSMLRGRPFLAEEGVAGKAPVAVLSYKLWSKRFGSDPEILGKAIELNRSAFTIVGVAPREFKGSQSGLSNDLWVPVVMSKQLGLGDLLENRSFRNLKVTARLQPGVTLAQAQAAVRTISAQLQKDHPETNRNSGLKVLAFTDAPYSLQGFLPLFRVFMIAVLLLLFIIAANITNLVMARSSSRRLELSIRLALGAGRLQMFRQFLAESTVLTAAGAVLGVCLSMWGPDLLLNFIPPTHLPVDAALLPEINWQILAYAVSLALIVGLVMGVAQSLQNRAATMYSSLKEAGRSPSTSVGTHRLSNALVVAEMTIAVIVLIGAGLCLKSLIKTISTSPGFNPANVLLAGLQLTPGAYTQEQGKAFFHRVQERVEALPEVESASLADWAPLGFQGVRRPGVRVEGYQPRIGEDMGICQITTSAGYFKTMGIPLLEGRDFYPDEGQAARLNSAIINQTMARRFWPGTSALGRRLRMFGKDLTVIGVSGDCKYQKLSEKQQCGLYLNFDQFYSSGMALHVRSRQDSPSLLATIQKEIYRIDPHAKITAAVPLQGFMRASYCYDRLLASLLVGVGTLALALSCMGIYGVLSWSVSQRQEEIGIRMALGATPWKVLKMVLFKGSGLMAVGIVAGVLIATVLSRYLSAFLAGVQPHDPLIYSCVCALLIAVGWTACFLPARRAASLDPMSVLRGE
jgi:predicted permease